MLWTMELEEFYQIIIAKSSSEKTEIVEKKYVPAFIEEVRKNHTLGFICDTLDFLARAFLFCYITGLLAFGGVYLCDSKVRENVRNRYLRQPQIQKKEICSIASLDTEIQKKASPLENIIWEFDAKSQINSAVIDSGIIYLSTSDALYALDARAGGLKWENRSIKERVSSSIPYEDTVFCGTDSGVYVIDARTGIQKTKPFVAYEKYISDHLISKVDSGTLFFVQSYGDKLHSIDISACNAKFLSGVVDTAITTPPLAWKNRVYFGTHDGLVRCIDAQTGNKLWKHLVVTKNPNNAHTTIGTISSIFAVAGNSLFVSEHGSLQALDLETGEPKWAFCSGAKKSYSEDLLELSSPCVSGGSVFVYDLFNFYSVDAETGKLKWKTSNANERINGGMNFSPCKPPLFHNKKVYVRTTFKSGLGSRIDTYDAETGEKERVIEFNAEITSNPVFQDNIIYMGINSKNKHKLISVDLEK